MEVLTPRQVCVSVLIYSLATLPWLVLVIATLTRKCPSWVLSTTSICTLICALGWEVWFTYGLWGGDPVDERRPDNLNKIMPIHINWILNSLDDGSICMIAIGLIYIVQKEGLRRFKWPALVICSLWFILQNILVEMVVYSSQLTRGKEISWAPLTPLGPWVNPTLFTVGQASCTLQAQLPWILMSPLFYFILLREQARCNKQGHFV